jgi:hypothetical protein
MFRVMVSFASWTSKLKHLVYRGSEAAVLSKAEGGFYGYLSRQQTKKSSQNCNKT